ncbi:MAG: hypothetical protein E6J91_09520 [Deltaproteobacteria bacterium]|nr:MAG: hypothetical protein E6J91_09520 [Deltaproteobacteria bacterium]
MHRLGELLVIEHVLPPAARDAAVARTAVTGERIGSAAIACGASADRVSMVLARQHGVLAARDHQLSSIPAPLRALLPEDDARRLCAVPLRVAPGTREVIIAVRDPSDPAVAAELTRITGMEVRVAVAAELRLRQALDVVYGAATADNPLLPRMATQVKQPEAARMLAELGAASDRGWRAGRTWRRLVERVLVVGLVVSLIGVYASHRRRAKPGASATRAIVEPRATPDRAGRLDPALEAFRNRILRCREEIERCLSDCERGASPARAAGCDDECNKVACADAMTQSPDGGARPGPRGSTP